MTKEIELTQGKVALVDDKDYKWLNKWKWSALKHYYTYYAIRSSPTINGKRTLITMHREILGLEPGDGKITDHINRAGLDNQRDNLRVVNNSINSRNSRIQKNNTSGCAGVSWEKRNKKWRVKIEANGKRIFLGYFDNLDDAVMARRQGELDHWHD